jgi:hypothetical protein
MRLPRLILNPAIRPWIFLWQNERRKNQQLRAELKEWQDRCLEQARIRPLFQPPPSPMPPTLQPPVGVTAKRAYLASQRSGNEPSHEEILAAAAKVNGNH